MSNSPRHSSSTNSCGNSFHQTQRLLDTYPFASATPSTHVARHLSNLSITATPPSYVQPSYYSTPANYGSIPPHQPELYQLTKTQTLNGGSEGAYWDACRGDVFQQLGDLSTTDYCASPPRQSNTSSAASSYQPSPFAQSVMQHAVPYNAYPTPPPASVTFSSSSSSLANALGLPVKKKAKYSDQDASNSQSNSTDSARFFDTFLNDRMKELPSSLQLNVTGIHSPVSTPSMKPSSPDPLCMDSAPSSLQSQKTPKRRKVVEVVITTPSKLSTIDVHSGNMFRPLSNGSPKPGSSSAKPDVTFTPPRIPRSQVYVAITPPSRALASPSQSHLDGRGVRSSGKRTGDRDDRAPLEKFLNLLDDIFEAEDNISSDADITSLNASFFSKLSIDPARPLLHSITIARLSKAISKIARPTKRMRLALVQWDGVVPGSPRKSGGMAEVEVQTLARLLKILERSVRAGEDADPFESTSYQRTSSSDAKMPSSTKAGTKDSLLGTENAHTEVVSFEDVAHKREDLQVNHGKGASKLSDEEIARLERSLETARDGVLAAECCIALLTSDRLPKQLLSEELISSCLATFKNSLTKIIYPFIEAPLTDSRDSSILLMLTTNRFVESAETFDVAEHRRLIGDIFQTLSAAFSRITNLVCTEGLSMTESIIIPAVFIAIGPFFVVEGGADNDPKSKKDSTASIITNTLGNSGMRGLRLEALSLVRNIFAHHEEQRSWIIEEILSSLVRLSDSNQKAGIFRLRDGRSIRTVSALLLELVQTSAHGVHVEAARLARSRQQHLALKRHDSIVSEVEEPFLDQVDVEEVALYTSGLEAPTKAAKAIVVFLTQRSGKGKSTKNANELEYRAIFDNLVSDLLVVLFWPEWPAASLLLSVICKFMITSLDDVKSSSNGDNNASKAFALDHLGVVAGRLRANALKCGKTSVNGNSSGETTTLKNLDGVVSTIDKHGLERLVNAHQEVASHLSKRTAEDHAYEGARELSAALWAQELAIALTQLNELMSNSRDQGWDSKERSKYLKFGSRVKSALRAVWRDAPTDVFDNTTQEEIHRADFVSQQLGTTQALANAFDPILNVIILALDAPPVFVRTKALRALSQILSADPNILSKSNVRHAIETHLLDSSPQVRDAAVELIGRYLIESPIIAGDYYQRIAERIADTGLGVRKRVIKLLKAFFGVTDDLDRKVDTCCKLVLRIFDEDDSVKDLAIKTLEEIWFLPNVPPGRTDRTGMLEIVCTIMGVCSVLKDRQSALEDVLSKIVTGKDGPDTSASRARFTQIYDALIDGLIDSSDFTNFTVVNCIRTIHLFTMALPSVMTGSKASVLLPYLKNSASNEDVIASDYILKIFRTSIPRMSKTSVKFGQDLQSILQPMILKPNLHGTSLQEVVACLCAVVQHLTHDYVRLVALLKSCITKLRQYIYTANSPLAPNDSRTLHILVFIVSLLGEHFDFDRLRTERPDLSGQLDSISKDPIVDYIYQCLLQLHKKYTDSTIRGRLLVCLGFLFRAQPTLMTLESSAAMMDEIFASPEEDNRGRLLKLMQEFLVSEITKHSEQQKSGRPNTGVDMDELVGNTHGFAESGVSSAVVQRYLEQILDAALSPVIHIQSAAVDILSFTIKQGLAHPLLSFPVIVALETSPTNSLSGRAVALHTILHHKHTSLLNSGFVSACRKSYDYQTTLAGNEGAPGVRGYRLQPTPSALLGRWYALVREKRATRQEFLRAALKVFELRDTGKTEGDTVHFVRYMAENFSSFDYRTQEEVLTVLKASTRELAETGVMIVERIAPGNLLAQLRSKQDQGQGVTEGKVYNEDASNNTEMDSLPLEEQCALMRSSCVVGIVMLLKAYLKIVYGLSEEKCQKFVLGKKSAVGDRPATRRKDYVISWERMPYALKTIRTAEDVEMQRTMFLNVWNEDGATAEPEGDEWE